MWFGLDGSECVRRVIAAPGAVAGQAIPDQHDTLSAQHRGGRKLQHKTLRHPVGGGTGVSQNALRVSTDNSNS
jgi:hypothetical protein